MALHVSKPRTILYQWVVIDLKWNEWLIFVEGWLRKEIFKTIKNCTPSISRRWTEIINLIIFWFIPDKVFWSVIALDPTTLLRRDQWSPVVAWILRLTLEQPSFCRRSSTLILPADPRGKVHWRGECRIHCLVNESVGCSLSQAFFLTHLYEEDIDLHLINFKPKIYLNLILLL